MRMRIPIFPESSWLRGEEADKAAQAHHEHQVEIGKRLHAAVEPLDAMLDVGEECGVLLLITGAVVDELREEQGDAELVGVEGDTGKREGNVGISQVLKLRLRTDIQLHFEDVQGLEILFLQLPLLRLGNMNDDRHASVALGKQVDDHFLLSVFQIPQYNCFCFCQHTLQK